MQKRAVTIERTWEKSVKKAQLIVAQSTLAEKANLTGGLGYEVGSRCEGTLGSIPRLGLPELCFQDGPTGVRASDFVTVFPAGLTTAATFNRRLMEQRGKRLAYEFRGKGINVLLGPATGGPLGRSVFQGRNWEGFGLDTYLNGEASYATVKGIQSQGVIATSKHFIAYEQETFRTLYAASSRFQFNPINNTEHAYSANINGTQGCQNEKVLTDILKHELNFQGFVVSDWSAVFDAALGYNAGTDVIMPGGAHGGGKRNLVTGQAMIDAVNAGRIPMERIDDAIQRLLTQYYYHGQDHGYPKTNYKDGWQGTEIYGVIVNEHVNVQTLEAKQVSKQVNEEAITLIFNNRQEDNCGPQKCVEGRKVKGTGLPLNKKARIAVFGSDAGPNPMGINGCQLWLGPGSNFCPGDSVSNGTNAMGWGSGAGFFPYLIDPLAALTESVEQYGGAISSNLNDTDLDGPNGKLIEQTAAWADASLVFVQARSGEDSDRFSLELEANGNALIQKVASISNNTIVIVNTVGAIFMDDWYNNPNISALLFPHLPGQESGNTLAEVLYGNVAPSGKMPYSILSKKDASNYIPIVRDMQPDGTIPIPFDEGVFIDYRLYDKKNVTPLIPFGHGISYTTFNHSDQLSAQPINDGSSYPTEVRHNTSVGGDSTLWKYIVSLSTSITNTGSSVSGKEVSQLYIGFPKSDSLPDIPVRQLVGFEKVGPIQPGETVSVSFKVTQRDMSYWDVVQQRFVMPDGDFTFWSGASSDVNTLKGKVTVTIKNGTMS
ncbi:glycoside hydrolase [Meira miltonrushii]|uniref:beta-glucosidase n=1 Tax=Meira miltonrushii TaxID=1280837 RepID=A0A316V4C5_9BASI|nr:glycoside hydrolase [Meira miltonrushii]PWN31858.1 glycoside hydrolase [Meira miltonrushii]